MGSRASDIADVIADIISDHSRVTWIVFGDARLDLANQVTADVGALRIDAAADAGEESNRAGAHGETADHGGVDRGITHKEVANPDQSKTRHRQTHHGAAG